MKTDSLNSISVARPGEIPGGRNGAGAAAPVFRPRAAGYATSIRIEEHAARTPDAPALVSGEVCMTYGELNRRAAQIASRLVALGVAPDDRVGVLTGRGPEMVAAYLGIWKAGGAYVPLDPENPDERLGFMVRDTGAKAVIVSESLRARISDGAATVLSFGEISANAPADPLLPVLPETSPATGENLAYVIFTSGSTGVPKGVAITHRNLAHLIDWHHHAYRISPADRATQLASPGFDAAVWEIWPYLASGASVHFPDAETRVSPARLVRWLHEQRITLSFLPTPLAEAALAETWPAQSTLRALLTGGDRLNRRPPRGFPTLLVNHYGPTECTVVATWGEVAPAGSDDGAPSIGRPIGDTTAYVLDEERRPVAPGTPGELYLGGPAVARGYLNRPELTAERFVVDYFDPHPAARMYRTGDLVRQRPDGSLDFLSRIDDQVKIRGHRIELPEIETVLSREPGVTQCAVVVHGTEAAERRLIAYVVPAPGEAAPSIGDLRRELRARLAEAMVPAHFVFVEALPLTTNGKVDRRLLAARVPVAPAREITPVRNAAEDGVARIWCDLLGLEAVGRDENFFDLGGHSLLATQALARVRSAFQADLPMQVFFDAPTVAAVAAAVEHAPQRPRLNAPGLKRRTGPPVART